MEGREQRELRIEQRIAQKLRQEPLYLTEFYAWMNGKTSVTKDKYISYVLGFLDFCKRELEKDVSSQEFIREITLDDLNRYVQDISYKTEKDEIVGRNDPNTMNAKICAVSTFFRYMNYKGIISGNLCERLDRPKIPDKDGLTFLTPEEISEVMDNLENGVGSWKAKSKQRRWQSRDRVILALPLITGIRISALIDINVDDLDLDKGELTVTEKENKRRVFVLPEKMLYILRMWLVDRQRIVSQYIGEEKALLITVYGNRCKRIGYTCVNDVIKKYSASTGKKITEHKLRASFAVNTYDATGDIYLVGEVLGHKNPQTTKRYMRASEEKKKNALEKMSKLI